MRSTNFIGSYYFGLKKKTKTRKQWKQMIKSILKHRRHSLQHYVISTLAEQNIVIETRQTVPF